LGIEKRGRGSFPYREGIRRKGGGGEKKKSQMTPNRERVKGWDNKRSWALSTSRVWQKTRDPRNPILREGACQEKKGEGVEPFKAFGDQMNERKTKKMLFKGGKERVQ